MHVFDENGTLLPEEKDAINVLTKLPLKELNLEAVAVCANLYRTAQLLKNKMEQEVLSAHRLSWTAFSILYDLWVWRSMETKRLAETSGVSKATVSNITKTLERKELCYRKTDPRDRRIVYVAITEKGREVMKSLYPRFHQGETELAGSLEKEEQKVMADLLRKIIRNNE
ncbi:MarR family transcriptional regulator [Bacillus glycinifermentans]|uniref:MarR family transcriptional regulator n=1 Tax=Bacillus glycinifermentans TaxID=1664069 RepID=A0A0J6E2L2_9BACI|nr:MarR family transcriptional regulator [Bacillus glycinifermentans]KMM62504.1 MarR family transcriptional regulator [Bacillus glycinifermentans]KRT92991.1 MarR family transcriptional regulator [Bacillus glycinifermentans]